MKPVTQAADARPRAERLSANRGGPWSLLPLRAWSWITDAVLLVVVLGLFYLFIAAVARTWFQPLHAEVVIARSPRALPGYAAASLLRIVVAYALSLVFALVYGYWAAANATAERFLIPLLDVLQSLPVLSFLPGVMLAMMALAPGREIGLELGSILLIFSGEVWNLAFSFYASLKAVPRELREAADLFGYSWWQRFRQLELPAAAIGLVWNSMMSVAGGWFFLMACEMFVLGDRSFRLPGLGSYLALAAARDDVGAIVWGLVAMVVVIVLLDQLVWRPAIAWSQRFKLEQVESGPAATSWVLNWWRRSVLARSVVPRAQAQLAPAARRARHAWQARPARRGKAADAGAAIARLAARPLAVAGLAAAGYALWRLGQLLLGIQAHELAQVGWGLLATLGRVAASIAIGAAWTIPVGVAIGSRPRLARVAQPLAQIAASVPATALFPVLLLLLLSLGHGLGWGSILLMLLGTQWYILFNVIAGALAIPSELREAAEVFGFGRWERWRRLILPSIFPYLLTGLVTASGGAWNASIIAEYFHFQGRTLSTVGIGALISQATDNGNLRLLIAATLALAATVTVLNRLVWRPLYRRATTRYALQG